MARCHHSHGHRGNRLPHHRQIGAKAAAAFYTAVINGELEVASLADVDWQRIQELVATCADMRLGGTDAHLDARNPDPSPAQPEPGPPPLTSSQDQDREPDWAERPSCISAIIASTLTWWRPTTPRRRASAAAARWPEFVLPPNLSDVYTMLTPYR
jgi:hypothetical protein